ncbi:MAG: amino acid adenylation domain-containing protein, partial [Opitutaceae bacterium]
MRVAAKRHGVTINTLVQGAWAVLLSRYSGGEDVVFGAVRACRHIPVAGAEAMVGLLINTLPVRVRIASDSLVGPWLQEVREQWLALRDFEHTSLTKIQRWSEIPAGRRLFETVVNYQEPSWDAALAALGGKWRNRHFEIRSQPSFPLALDVCGGAALTATLIYDRGRFSDDAMARMLGHFRVVLEAMADDTPRTVGELPMLTEAETRQVLVEWNRTGVEFPRDRSVAAWVEANAREHPDCLAVADVRGSLNYGELNRRANRVARRLKAAGVGRGGLVAVCMKPATEMIVAWLGVLKAGAAFVPLDSSSPPERLAFQLKDCGARVLLTQPKLRTALPPVSPTVDIVDLRADGSGFETELDGDLECAAAPTDLAYVIYTSGSTGRPKGVEIEHGALMNLVSWHRAAYAVTPEDRASQVASPAFDAAVWEIWPYLVAGASVHIADEETRRSPQNLVRWLAEKRITLAFLPTPLAEATMEEAWPNETALRAVLTGGDKLKRVPPAGFPCALFNHYGPTENAVVTTWGEIARSETGATEPAIGRPIANVQVYVLDACRRPLPIGLPGELFVGGASLARGYLNGPELTAEKFVPAADGTGRLYRTGDIVRWRADGQLEFIGRHDGQVKIRGYRIELGEIESGLQRHPVVREALVLVRATANGSSQLVAYVRSHENAARATPEALTEHLSR